MHIFSKVTCSIGIGSCIDWMHVLVVLYLVMQLPVAFMGSHCGGNVGTSDKVSMSAVSLNYFVTLIPVNYMHYNTESQCYSRICLA